MIDRLRSFLSAFSFAAAIFLEEVEEVKASPGAGGEDDK